MTITEGTAMRAVASPDRRSIAIDLLGALWVLPFQGGDAKKITPDTIEARDPSWSFDSQSLTFQGYDDGWHIFTVRADGTGLTAVTSGPFDDRHPDWSRDGARIAFSSDRDGGIVSIWEFELPTRTLAPVSSFEGDRPCWAASDDRQVWFLGRNPRRGTPGRPVPLQYWLAAPGRPELPANPREPVAMSGTMVIGRLNSCANGTVTLFPSQADPFPSESAQTVGAPNLLLVERGRLTHATIGSGLRDPIPFKATLTLQRHDYAKRHRLLQPDEPQPVKGVVGPAVSPDGKLIAFVALGDLWVLPLGQQPVQLTNDRFVERDPAWSPDGTRLAFVSDRGGKMDLWVKELSTGSDLQLTRGTGRVSGPSWAPAGDQIAYLIDRRDTAIANPTTGGQSDFGSRSTPERGRPTWAASGKIYAVGDLFRYSNRFPEGTNQLLLRSIDGTSVAADTLLVHRSAGNRRSGGPVWSPNGYQMALVSESRLWSIPVDSGGKRTGDPMMIATDQPSSPSWEGDSRHLVYQTPDGLRRILAEGSPPEAIDAPLAYLPVPPPEREVVHAGSLVAGTRSDLLHDTDILIVGGRIREIAPHNDDLHIGTVIDASNETVMPGLFDMSAHLDADYGEALGRILLAYGITSVRDPNADAYDTLEMRESYDAGKRIGPRVFTSGDRFSGARVLNAGGVSITSSEQLEDELERATKLDDDFFATDVRLPDKYLKRITEYAHTHGRAVTSPALYPAAALGADGVDGLRGRDRRGLPSNASEDSIGRQDVIDLLARSGLTLTPTLAADGGWLVRTARDRSLLADPRMLLFPAQREIESLIREADQLSRDPNLLQRLEGAAKALAGNVGNIAAAGGTILAGSRSPDIPYGVGLHAELEQFVDAGLSPFQALQTATANAAEALGVADELGTIEPGKLADLVIVDGNPLQDIKAARKVRAVIRGGWSYSAAALGVR